MNEAEFRSQLDALGRKYQDHIRDMNSVDSPGFKKKHQQLAQTVISEITALEKKREVAKAYAYIKLRDCGVMVVEPPEVTRSVDPVGRPERDLGYWRERRTAKLKEGAHIDVIRYIERQIRDLGASDPESDTLSWTDYYDHLIKEWFDGERALIDDIYSDPPKKAMRRSLRSWCSPLVVGATALCVSVTAVLVMLVWIAKMLIGF